MHLTKAISTLSSLQSLTLEAAGVKMSNIGLREIGEGIVGNRNAIHLEWLTLDLGHNSISESGAFELARSIEKLDLQQLALSVRSTWIGDIGAQRLISGVAKIESLKELSLDMAFCGFQDDQTIEALVEDLKDR
eukprot:5939106-Amphidinium_carterae.1